MGLVDEIRARATRPRPVKKIEGKPWDRDDLYVKKMSGAELDEYRQGIIARCNKNGDMTKIVGWRASVICSLACDENGKKVFTPDDVSWLNESDTDDLDLVFDAIREFNGLRQEDQEDLEKNSAAEGGSGSSSPSVYLSGEPREAS